MKKTIIKLSLIFTAIVAILLVLPTSSLSQPAYAVIISSCDECGACGCIVDESTDCDSSDYTIITCVDCPTPTPTPGPTLYEISGFVFDDTDQDGLRDTSEICAFNCPLGIDFGPAESGINKANVCIANPATGACLSTPILTNFDGRYVFSGLTAGTYSIKLDPVPDGRRIHSPSTYTNPRSVTVGPSTFANFPLERFSPPVQPTVTLPSACIYNPLTQTSPDQITISWTNPPEDLTPVTWADISTNSDFTSYFHKSVSGISQTSAPAGFNGFVGVVGGLIINPNQDYFLRLSDNLSHSPSSLIRIPQCPAASLSLIVQDRGSHQQPPPGLTSYGLSGLTVDQTQPAGPAGINWFNPIGISLASSAPAGQVNQYYLAFYERSSAFTNPTTFLADVQTLLHSDPRKGFLLSYGSGIRPGETDQYYVWDYTGQEWINITTQLLGLNICVGNANCTDRNSLYRVFPAGSLDPSLPNYWRVKFWPEFGSKTLKTAGLVARYGDFIGFGSSLTPQAVP